MEVKLMLFENSWLVKGIITSIVATAVLTIIGFFFKKEIRGWWRYYRFKNKNESFKIKFQSIRKYGPDAAPNKWLSNDIFTDLNNKLSTDVISKRALNNNCIKIYSKNLNSNILIWLQEDLDLTTMNDEIYDINGYSNLVETENEVKMVIKEIDDVCYFNSISESSHEIIEKRCFDNGINSTHRYVLANINMKFDILNSLEFEDTDLHARILMRKNIISISLNNPAVLEKVLKKYIEIFVKS